MTTHAPAASTFAARRIIGTMTLALALAACGGEAGMIGGDATDAAAAADLTPPAADGPGTSPDMATAPAGDMAQGADGGLIACFGNAEECTAAGECCSKMCASGICTAPMGACAAPSQACKGPEDCCSGNCGNGLCTQPLGICQKVGQACAGPTNCCTGRCTNNVCTIGGLVLCKALDSACKADSDCCSESCSAGVCIEPIGQCNAPNTRCTKASECCSGKCAASMCGNTVRCSALGNACVASYQCCSDFCDANGKCSVRRAP